MCFVLLSQGSFRVLVVCLLGFVLSVCVSRYCCCGYDATSVLERRRCCVLGGMNRDSFQERGEGMPVPWRTPQGRHRSSLDGMTCMPRDEVRGDVLIRWKLDVWQSVRFQLR